MATPAIPDDELNAMATADAARKTHLSMHTASPGTTGANEAAGGSPAYARKPLSFPNVAGAVGPLGASLQPATVGVVWSDVVTFDLAAGTYSHFGTWSALTAGIFRGGNQLASSKTIAGQNQISVAIGVGPFAPGA